MRQTLLSLAEGNLESIHTGVHPWNSIRSFPRFIFQSLFFALRGRVEADFVFVLVSDYASVIPLYLNRLFWRRKFKIIYDPFISLFDTYVFNKPIAWRPFQKAIFYWIDRTAFNAADILLIDTDAHADYLARLLHISRNKFKKVLVGFDPEIFLPQPDHDGFWQKPLRVLWYGKPSAVHAPDVIFDSIALTSEAISFTFVLPLSSLGSERLRALKSMSRVRLIDCLPVEEIRNAITSHHICLGGFGSTHKASAVVMNKEYEALAMGRALITRDGKREFLEHDVNCLQVVPGSSAALAKLLNEINEDRNRLMRVASQGKLTVRATVPQNYTRDRLAAIISELDTRN